MWWRYIGREGRESESDKCIDNVIMAMRCAWGRGLGCEVKKVAGGWWGMSWGQWLTLIIQYNLNMLIENSSQTRRYCVVFCLIMFCLIIYECLYMHFFNLKMYGSEIHF